MNISVPGGGGDVGSVLARSPLEARAGLEIAGRDNLIHPGSEIRSETLEIVGVRRGHGGIPSSRDFEGGVPASNRSRYRCH